MNVSSIVRSRVSIVFDALEFVVVDGAGVELELDGFAVGLTLGSLFVDVFKEVFVGKIRP